MENIRNASDPATGFIDFDFDKARRAAPMLVNQVAWVRSDSPSHSRRRPRVDRRLPADREHGPEDTSCLLREEECCGAASRSAMREHTTCRSATHDDAVKARHRYSPLVGRPTLGSPCDHVGPRTVIVRADPISDPDSPRMTSIRPLLLDGFKVLTIAPDFVDDEVSRTLGIAVERSSR